MNSTISKLSNVQKTETLSSPLPGQENVPVVPLSPKEIKVLSFIEGFIASFGFSPSYQEIKDHFGLASFNSVQNYLKQLTNKGYIHNPLNQKRAIRILRSSNASRDQLEYVSTMGSPRTPLLQSNDEILSLPLLGKVAAGLPLESFKFDETIEVPRSLVKNIKKSFALIVNGDSMIDEGILDGDYLIIEEKSHANSGELVVATIESEATVKRIYFSNKDRKVELRPSNKNLKSQWYSDDQVSIRGLIVGLFRKY